MTKPSSGEILTFVSIEASTFWNGYITYHHVTSPPFAEPPFLVQCPLFHDISKLYQIIPSLFVAEPIPAASVPLHIFQPPTHRRVEL